MVNSFYFKREEKGRKKVSYHAPLLMILSIQEPTPSKKREGKMREHKSRKNGMRKLFFILPLNRTQRNSLLRFINFLLTVPFSIFTIVKINQSIEWEMTNDVDYRSLSSIEMKRIKNIGCNFNHNYGTLLCSSFL